MKFTLSVLLLSLVVTSGTPAFGQNHSYDLSTVFTAAPNVTSTPLTVGIATFISPTDPGAFTVSQNNGFFSNIPNSTYTLSDGGFPATLVITFALPQSDVSFFYGTGNFFQDNADETLTVTTNSGATLTDSGATLHGTDFFPDGTFSYSTGTPFTQITISDSDVPVPGGGSQLEDLTIANLTSRDVPEPSTWALMVFGAGACGVFGYLRRRQAAA